MWDILIRLDSWLARLRYGPGVELRWLGGSAIGVVRLLRAYGIKTYDPRIPAKNERSIRVPAKQATWAEYVCRRAGVPLVGDTVDRANDRVTADRGVPVAWGVPARRVGFAGAVAAMFGSGNPPQIVTAARRLARRK